MSTDMSTDMPTDMGSGSSDDGSTSPGDGGTPDDGSDAEDEPRCTQVAPGAPTGSWIALLALGALGMVRRRR
ncbi:MAG: MYXO-CTERM sorting domain-containing protein, partial [Myxococcota bacterium]